MGQPAIQPTTIPLDLRATAAAFAKGWKKVSWSKLTTNKRCVGSWFFENYAVPLERTVYHEDSVHGIPGTIIQRIWEGVINDRVYRRPEFQKDREALLKWMRGQTWALYKTIVMPMEVQFEMPREVIRGFFHKSDAGKQRLEHAKAQWGLDPIFCRGLQPKFTNIPAFEERHTSLVDWINKLGAGYEAMFKTFDQYQINLDLMWSEQFVGAKLNDTELAGGVDFLYNRGQQGGGFFNSWDQLQPGFILLDGKAQIGATVDEGQLDMYALLIYLRYRKMPSMCGFADWSRAIFVWQNGGTPFQPMQLEGLKRRIQALQGTSYKINESLQRTVQQAPADHNTIELYDIPFMEFTPSNTNCLFCGASNNCKYARQNGFAKFQRAPYIKPAPVAPEFAAPQANPDQPLSDFTL